MTWFRRAGLLALPRSLWEGLRRRRSDARACAARLAERFRSELELRHPAVEWIGFVPRTATAVVGVDGQEALVPLGRLQRRAEVFPEAFARLVDQLVGEVRELGLERATTLKFEAVAADLVPQVRTVGWLDNQAGRFGDGGLVARPLFADLIVVLAIDRGEQLTFVPRGLARSWRRSEDQLVALALANLRRRSGPDLAPEVAGDAIVADGGDGFDAARLCLLDLRRHDGISFAVPDRDLLWLGRLGAAELELVATTTAAIHAKAVHPISPDLYRVRHGRVERIGPVAG